MKKETKCIHSGTRIDKATGGINTPVYTSSAFDYRDRDEVPYPRYFNTPNQDAVVEKLCDLEGAETGILFSSGMAAISTSILAFAGSGDHVILMDDLYGGSHAFATNEFGRLGVEHSFVPTSPESIRDAVRDNTRVIVIESPTNPLLNVIDIQAVAELAREKNIVTIIDNTFASPINQNPIGLGIDIVVHSGTKYLGGHSDICCGFAVTDREKTRRIRSMALSLGGSLNAFMGYLLERSMKTLALRVERQTQNASVLAVFLNQHPSVRQVNYPGLAGSAGFTIASRQMKGFGAMLSFEVDETVIAAAEFEKRLRLIKPAVSLGGVESTICSPALTSHAKISAEDRRRIGIRDALLRLSVGIENVDDLVADIKQAFDPDRK